MRTTLLLIIFGLQTILFAQKSPCELAVNVTDSIGTLKETKSCLVYEKNFGNNSQLVFLNLVVEDNIPTLHLQIIQKSTDFIAPKCLDKNSRIFFQLSNGKIYTFINTSESQCDNLIYNQEEKLNNRFLDAKFFFRKDDFEDIKKYPISMMQIKLASETQDYVLNKELVGEKVAGTYYPESFFIDSYSCIE
jgi:hypothetical protein